MGDRNRLRARSPIRDPARSSLQSFNYGTYPELHAIPTRREIVAPRGSADGGLAPPVVKTTYKVTGERSRADSRARRSTLDSHARPIVTSAPRVTPSSSYIVRPSDEEYYAIPASSSSRRHSKSRYSATYDNGDYRDKGLLRADSQRKGYPTNRPRSTAPTFITRRPDTMADDYGADGYGYTNPRDVVQYDLARSAPRYDRSYAEPVHEPTRRPVSIAGIQDLQPKKYDTRGGPPTSSRGFDRIYDTTPQDRREVRERAPVYDERRAPVYEEKRRPVSLYHDERKYHDEQRYSDERRHHERNGHRERPDDDLRREPRRERYIDESEHRGHIPSNERELPRHKHDARDEPNNRYDDRDETRTKYEHRDDRRRDDIDEREKEKKEKRRDTLGTVLGIAGTALGITGLANVNKGDSDRDSDEREQRRRKSREEEPARKDSYDERRRERDEDRTERSDDTRRRDRREESRRRKESRDEQFHDADRSERASRGKDTDVRSAEGIAVGRHTDQKRDVTPPSSADDPQPEVIPRQHRLTAAPAFDPKNTMDLKALKEALNRQDAHEPVPVAVPARAKESTTFDPRDPSSSRDIKVELERSNSGSKSQKDFSPSEVPSRKSSGDSIPIVSPPSEAATTSTAKPAVKGILRPPREKFPEEANPVREGVAPLKDSKKDGIPPDARWTKISRSLVNPEALELGKERFEARDECVIVLRVLTKEEVQGYAEVTQKIRRKFMVHIPSVSRIDVET